MSPDASKCLLITYVSAFAMLQTFPFPWGAQKTPGYPVSTINLFHVDAKSGTRTPHLSQDSLGWRDVSCQNANIIE